MKRFFTTSCFSEDQNPQLLLCSNALLEYYGGAISALINVIDRDLIVIGAGVGILICCTQKDMSG